MRRLELAFSGLLGEGLWGLGGGDVLAGVSGGPVYGLRLGCPGASGVVDRRGAATIFWDLGLGYNLIY